MIEPAIKLPYTSDYKEASIPLNPEQVSILVVDDLPEKILAYEAILEELGQNIVAVRSGEEALRMVLKQEFAVILLDVNMPGMDGFETAALIRQRKKSSHTPIIFLTAFTDEVRMAQGYASGAVDYLPTPVVPETLKAKVRVFIELSQMRRQAALQAEEHALRQAAEESARRSEFLMMASEIFTRSQDIQMLAREIIQLPIPFLADASVLWLSDKEMPKPWLGWSSHYPENEKKIYSQSGEDVLKLFPLLEETLKQTLEAGQARYISRLPSDSFSPVAQDNVPFFTIENTNESYAALALPITTRGQPCGVLVLARKNIFSQGELALATEFAARASASLENTLLFTRIQEADQRKNEFLAMLAHELRNPLAPIRNALYVMRISPDVSLRQQAEETIDRQLKHMVHLVDDLMDISRITQGKIELRKENMSLNDALAQAIETAQTLIQQKKQTLSIDMPPDVIWLNADFSRISQIFANLLNNAAKYTDNGGHIHITAEKEGNQAVIIIRDNGIGIPADMVTRIFDMFLQVDSSLERAQGGLGIGLTLVKNLVEMHGGTIEVQSKGQHEGSEFKVTLPAVDAPENIAPTKEQEAQAKSDKTLNVLIVDDNVESAKTLGWMVEEIFGHGIHLAHNGPDALECARQVHPDIVLLDIGLPGMNGYEVCKAMREVPGMERASFIAQTGWGQAEHRQRSKEAGFHHHLVKPVDMNELQKLMTELAQDHLATPDE